MSNKVIITYHDVNQNIAEETLWIEKRNDLEYQVKNIPFFAPNIALDDIISVEDDDGTLYFEDLIKTSEHSTIQIVSFKEEMIKDTIKSIEDLGCSWEGMDNQMILAVDIPPSVNYSIVQKYLTRMLNDKIFDFKEACLSKTHFSNI